MNSFAASVSNSTEMNDLSILVKQDSQATDECENEPRGLRILEDFHKLYENCIEKIDQESGAESDRVSVSSIWYQTFRVIVISSLAFLSCYVKCSKL